MKYTIEDVSKIVEGRIENKGEGVLAGRAVSIDSREIKEGEIFFALKGGKFDGAEFVDDAIRKGAVFAVVGSSYRGDAPIVRVEDPLYALYRLAFHHRRTLKAKVIAITGSVGKTTTKELLYHILKDHFITRRAKKSFNNIIGVPLTVLSADEQTEVLITELGTNHIGELKPLVELVEPDIGIITWIGRSHLEFFGSVEEVAKEKATLLEGIKDNGIAYINAQTPYFDLLKERVKAGVKIITFGIESGDIKPDEYEIDMDEVRFKVDGISFYLPIGGRGNLMNALAAIGVARELGVDLIKVSESLRDFPGVPMRMERSFIKGIEVINDAYNSNPDSLLQLFKSIKEDGKRNIFVIGDMLELGELSEELHREMGREFVKSGHRYIITLGEFSQFLGEEAQKGGAIHRHFENPEDAYEYLKSMLKEGDRLILKASRRMGLERIVEMLRRDC